MINNGHYLYRMTILNAISLLAPVMGAEVTCQTMLPVVIDAAKDRYTNCFCILISLYSSGCFLSYSWSAIWTEIDAQKCCMNIIVKLNSDWKSIDFGGYVRTSGIAIKEYVSIFIQILAWCWLTFYGTTAECQTSSLMWLRFYRLWRLLWMLR